MAYNDTKQGVPIARKSERKSHKRAWDDQPVKYMEEDYDLKKCKKFQEGREEIKRFLSSIIITTYGALGRRYAEETWLDVLDDILRDLDSEGAISFNPRSPAPTKITFVGQIRRQTPTLTYNQTLTIKPNERTYPFAAFEGEKVTA